MTVKATEFTRKLSFTLSGNRKVMDMKKVVISVLLIYALLIGGCFLSNSNKAYWGYDVEADGVTYFVNPYLGFTSIKRIDDELNTEKNIHIKDEVGGYPVTDIGLSLYLSHKSYLDLSYRKTEKIYFPWSIDHYQSNINFGTVGNEIELKYIISASNIYVFYDDLPYENDFVVTMPMYNKVLRGDRVAERDIKDADLEKFLPANIAFLFNYEESPNKDYFFVDLLEESAKITKPPYDPKREGYTFEGWYKEPECLNKWNFDTDEVIITFDGEGNRIYEEIKLYAKWEQR